MLRSTSGFKMNAIHFYLCDEEENLTGNGKDGQDTWVELRVTPSLIGSSLRFKFTNNVPSDDEVSFQLPHIVRGEGNEAFEGHQFVEVAHQDPDGEADQRAGGRDKGRVQKLRLHFAICAKAANASDTMAIAGPDTLEFEIVDDVAQEECMRVLQDEKCKVDKSAAREEKTRDAVKKKLDAKDAEYRQFRVKICVVDNELPERSFPQDASPQMLLLVPMFGV